MDSIILELNNITKSFGDTVVLKGLNLKIHKGEFITLLGSSGCGKTTTLRIIAGLDYPDSGTVFLEKNDVTFLNPEKRNVNTVFQNYALFPHMTVEKNIAYSLKIKKMKKNDIKTKVYDALEAVQLKGYENRFPNELSGGQKQRVAIARAIVNNPKILLLDEPLGALDLQLRRQMQIELKKLQKKLNLTFIYITHDQEEALNMSDRIAVMKNGVFEQIDTPSEIYDYPKTSYVATFVGMANIIKAQIVDIDNNLFSLKTNNRLVKVFYNKKNNLELNSFVNISVRSEHISISLFDETLEGVVGIIKEKSFVGGMEKIKIILEDNTEIISSRLGINSHFKIDDKVIINWNQNEATFVDVEYDKIEK